MKDCSEPLEKELCFFGSDPGAVKHGNFINYYSFHDVQERIKNLHPIMFPTPLNNQLICLDVGCNTGDLTNAVYKYLRENNPDCDIHVLAVDIDSTLIERAKESFINPDITFHVCDIMTQNGRMFIQNFLSTFNRKYIDVVLCFSVTMWIHLNNGDAGILEFLGYLKNITRSIVIEPQPWKCYQKAQKRVRRSGRSFELYSTLKIRSNVISIIENNLTGNSFSKVFESTNSSWDRTIKSFQSLNEVVNSL